MVVQQVVLNVTFHVYSDLSGIRKLQNFLLPISDSDNITLRNYQLFLSNYSLQSKNGWKKINEGKFLSDMLYYYYELIMSSILYMYMAKTNLVDVTCTE